MIDQLMGQLLRKLMKPGKAWNTIVEVSLNKCKDSQHPAAHNLVIAVPTSLIHKGSRPNTSPALRLLVSTFTRARLRLTPEIKCVLGNSLPQTELALDHEPCSRILHQKSPPKVSCATVVADTQFIICYHDSQKPPQKCVGINLFCRGLGYVSRSSMCLTVPAPCLGILVSQVLFSSKGV